MLVIVFFLGAFVSMSCGGRPRIIVVSPNGGEEWYHRGDDREIVWIAEDVRGDVEIRYSTDGGATYPGTVAAVSAADGRHLWTIPDESSTKCRVRVSAYWVSDESDADFAIVPTPFTDMGEVLPARDCGSLAWGDYDNDGDLDLAMTGWSSSGRHADVYVNSGGVFAAPATGLPGVVYSSVAWGDYDGDGDLDLALAGDHVTIGPLSRVYDNSAGGLADSGAGLPGIRRGSIAWGDCDNDGDLDLALAGLTGGSPGVTGEVYRNDGTGIFAAGGAGLPYARFCSLAWGDYDRDGDLDLAVAGETGFNTWICAVYGNGGDGLFADIGADLVGVRDCSIAWGDHDNDGDLDLVIAGTHEVGPVGLARLYRNDAWTLVEEGNTTLAPVCRCSVAWGDYDNDGDLDLALAGATASWDRVAKIYRNDGGSLFTDIGAGLTGVDSCSLAWGDWDNDGDLDLVLAGSDSGVTQVTKLYRNDLDAGNAPPSAPTGLSTILGSGEATFGWDAATDAETPALGLTYNLRVGTEANKDDVMPSHAFVGGANDGKRLIPAMGNVQHNTSWTLTLPPGTYYWTVQAIDTAYAGSPWAPEQTVTVP